MARPELTDAQRADADRLYAALRATCDADLRGLAELLASKSDRDIFGATEFEVRDRVHAIGAKAIEAAVAGREKGATAGRAPGARPAGRRRSSSGGSRGGS